MNRKILIILGILSFMMLSTVSASVITSKPTFIDRIFPFFAHHNGTWQCDGKCIYNGVDVSNEYNCVLDPTQVIPEGGYDSFTGETPRCVCLKKNPGTCAFYDANYGEGLDNLQCGGSCPIGEVCSSYKSNGRDICNCTIPQDVKKCGFHFDDLTTASVASTHTEQELESACYGWCDNTQSDDCKLWRTSEGQLMCDCWGEKPQETSCESIDVSDGSWWKCWTQGTCSQGNECVYNQYTQKCGCQGIGDCGWHITLDEARELQSQFGTNVQGAVDYIKANWDDYCYGICQANTYCQYFQVDYQGRTIHDCTCGTATPDYPPSPFQNVISRTTSLFIRR